MRLKKQQGPPSAQRPAPIEEAILISSLILFYDKSFGVATLKSIATGPYPSVSVALTRARLLQMGVQI
jgi:hypothetical protein